MTPNKTKTAVHGCHCQGDMAVRMCKVLARPWVGVRVCHLLLLFFFINGRGRRKEENALRGKTPWG